MTPIEEKAQAYAESQIDGIEFINEYECQCVLNDYKQTYLAGTKDILSLPLSERLTEEEKEKIRAKYNENLKKIKHNACQGYDDYVYSYQNDMLIELFGSDFFKEGGNDGE